MTHSHKFKHIGLISRQRLGSMDETLLALYNHLRSKGCSVIFEEETAKQMVEYKFEGVPSTALSEMCELLLVVGGDGSLLHAARIAVDQSLPVLGINRGRLGFLTDVYPHEFDKIERVLSGAYIEEKRFLLRAEIQHRGQKTPIAIVEGLNEIVLSPGNIAHMVEFDIVIDNQFVCEQRADGLIIATPTGSTAYALSGGGPIVHPSLNAVVLVPMFPHTLTNRPIVIDADSRIEIKIAEYNKATPYISGDGQLRIPVPLGDTICIQKKSRALRLIHPLDYHYFETLRAKLGWQSKTPPV